MRVIDARSGEEMTVGKTVNYGDEENLTLLAVRPGLLTARALVRTRTRHFDGALREGETWVDLAVRYTHPAFFAQHVAFIPS